LYHKNLNSLRFIFYTMGLFSIVIIAGCNPARQRMEEFNSLYQQGQFREAEKFCAGKIKNYANPGREDLLWALQLAAVQRAQKKYDDSTLWFDRCEDMMKTFDPQWRETDILGTTLVNDNIIPYRGQTYDGVLVNTYKALNFIAIGKDDLARVEFNRAMERQTRAKEKFSAEIQKEKDKLDKLNADKKVDYSKSSDNPDIKSRIQQAYPQIYEFEAYPDFTNPFSTYLAGVFFTILGDVGKARDLLRESAGMVPDNPYIQKDFEVADRWINNLATPEPTVWVFFENGVGPIKDEFRVDLPLFLFTGKVYYAGIALPRLVERWPATPRLSVQSNGQTFQTELVGDMDRVIQTEFAKEYPWIITRAIVAAGTKAAAQVAILQQNESSNQLAAAAVALYSWATTAADLRIWSALPRNFQVARIPMPADGKLDIRSPQGYTYPIVIHPCRYAIVYIKMVSALIEPTIEVTAY